MCIHIVCVWGGGGALVGVLVVLAPIREALHATEITGQITIQLFVTRPVPTPQCSTGDRNHFDGILSSLWSELCLPSSSLSSTQSTIEKRETSQILYQRVNISSLFILSSGFPQCQAQFSCFSSLTTQLGLALFRLEICIGE